MLILRTPTGGGRRVVYGTDDGVYLSDLREPKQEPVKVLALLDVLQVDVLEDYQLLIVLSGNIHTINLYTMVLTRIILERQVITFPLDALDPLDPMAGLKRAKRISSHTSFFKAGFCLGRVLVCIVKSSQLSSTFKTLEPIDQNIRGRAKPTFKKLLQGGNDTLKLFRVCLLFVRFVLFTVEKLSTRNFISQLSLHLYTISKRSSVSGVQEGSR